MNQHIATKHKEKYFALIDSAGQTVTVTPPATRTAGSTTVDKVLGTTGYVEGEGTDIEVTAWVHQGPVSSNAQGGGTQGLPALLGEIAESDIILSVKLEDVLTDSTKVYGRTVFDTALKVTVSGSEFEVVGTPFRSGLAPLGPYLLWVGLRHLGA